MHTYTFLITRVILFITSVTPALTDSKTDRSCHAIILSVSRRCGIGLFGVAGVWMILYTWPADMEQQLTTRNIIQTKHQRARIV